MKNIVQLLILLSLFSQCIESKKSEVIQPNDVISKQKSKAGETIDSQLAPIVKEISEPVVKPPVHLSLTVSVDSIYFQGLKFIGLIEDMKAVLREPDSIVEPLYDCGPFSQDWQEKRFFQYFYGQMNFICYDDIAEIQDLKFIGDIKLSINGQSLSSEMGFESVATVLGIEPPIEEYSKNSIHLLPKEPRDEWYYLVFKNGLLHHFERYDPC